MLPQRSNDAIGKRRYCCEADEQQKSPDFETGSQDPRRREMCEGAVFRRNGANATVAARIESSRSTVDFPVRADANFPGNRFGRNTVALRRNWADFGDPFVHFPGERSPAADGIIAHLALAAPWPGLSAAGDGTLLEDFIQDVALSGWQSHWGESAGRDNPAPHDIHRMEEGQSIGVGADLPRGLVDRAAHRVVGQHQAFRVPVARVPVSCCAEGHRVRACGFSPRHGRSRSPGGRGVGIKQRRDQGAAFRHAWQAEHEHPDRAASPAGPAVSPVWKLSCTGRPRPGEGKFARATPFCSRQSAACSQPVEPTGNRKHQDRIRPTPKSCLT